MTGSALPDFRCVECGADGLSRIHDSLGCTACGAHFAVADKRPVLIRRDNEVFNPGDYSHAIRSLPQALTVRDYIPDLSINLSARRVLGRMRTLLDALSHSRVLVVGGGRQRGWLDPALGAGARRRVVYVDIDSGADIDIFADAHELPFADGVFDAVVTTAVLEHVLYPERAAAEITRVTRLGGYLYSELPFMQQVHEGAYDFTRYTLSGHRRLFRDFTEIESGMVAGPGTALAWSIENLVLAFLRGPKVRLLAKAGVRTVFFWLKHLDRLLEDRAEAMDGASCTYLLGERVAAPRSDKAIIASYLGAKPISHV